MVDQRPQRQHRHPAPAGLIVVDVDPRAGGHDELAHLLNRHGPLPATWTTETGSGGWHLWF
ncbi:MAG TPA: bifunctional DNA primase/polymerase, partial [Mycobacterium sp.]